MAALIALLYPPAFALPTPPTARSLVFCSSLPRLARADRPCREIVKERTIVLRELVVGVRLDAYLLQAGFCSCSRVQCALL